MKFVHYKKEEFPQLDKYFRRNLINSLSGYKSLNLVGTQKASGLQNVAPFSQIFHLGASPALMGMIVRPDSVARHTLENLQETGFYTFNHVREEFYRQAHQSSARYEESEFEACGLEPEYQGNFPAPFVKQAYIKIGLQFEERQDLKINNTIFIIGSVQSITLPEDCLSTDGFIDLQKAGTVAGSGLDAYYLAHKLARLSYAKPNQDLEEI